jgi:hypothetical protein
MQLAILYVVAITIGVNILIIDAMTGGLLL